MRDLLTVLVLLGSGLTTGVMFCVALSLVPAFRALSYDDYRAAHLLFGKYFDRVMPPVVIATILCMAGLAAMAGAGVLNIVALAAQLSVSVVSQFGNVPINRRVKSGRCSADDDPRAAWRRWHFVRLTAALSSLVLFSAWLVTS